MDQYFITVLGRIQLGGQELKLLGGLVICDMERD